MSSRLTNERKGRGRDAHISSCSLSSTRMAVYLLNIAVRSRVARGKGLHLLRVAVRSELLNRTRGAPPWYGVKDRRHGIYVHNLGKESKDKLKGRKWIEGSYSVGSEWTRGRLGLLAGIKSNRRLRAAFRRDRRAWGLCMLCPWKSCFWAINLENHKKKNAATLYITDF